MSVCAVLLAAGESIRMGSPKPLLEWFGATLIEYQVESLLAGGAESVIAVTGAYNERVSPLLEKMNVRHVYNPDFAQGKATSIKAGISALPSDAHMIVLIAVDQPRPHTLIRYAIEEHKRVDALITAPYCAAGGGHPLVFNGVLRNELAVVNDANKGLREVLARHSEKVYRLRIETVLIRLDINTLPDYSAALKDYTRLVEEVSL